MFSAVKSACLYVIHVSYMSSAYMSLSLCLSCLICLSLCHPCLYVIHVSMTYRSHTCPLHTSFPVSKSSFLYVYLHRDRQSLPHICIYLWCHAYKSSCLYVHLHVYSTHTIIHVTDLITPPSPISSSSSGYPARNTRPLAAHRMGG